MIDWNPIAKKFREADAILIGTSNGLSITEGSSYIKADCCADGNSEAQRKGLGRRCSGKRRGWSLGRRWILVE